MSSKHAGDQVWWKVYKLHMHLAMFQAINFDWLNPQKTPEAHLFSPSCQPGNTV